MNRKDGVGRYNEDMTAAFIVETERWDLAAKLFATEPAKAAEDMTAHAAHNQPAAAPTRGPRSQSLPSFIRGLAAAKLGLPDAARYIAELHSALQQVSDKGENYAAKSAEIKELEVSASVAAAKQNYSEAIEMMKRATSLEEEMSPPSGPPSLIKPSHELFGEILLAANRPTDATEQFSIALLRQPNRARSLLGLARSASKSGDTKTAVETYSKLIQQWSQCDQNLPELREAQDYLKQAVVR